MSVTVKYLSYLASIAHDNIIASCDSVGEPASPGFIYSHCSLPSAQPLTITVPSFSLRNIRYLRAIFLSSYNISSFIGESSACYVCNFLNFLSYFSIASLFILICVRMTCVCVCVRVCVLDMLCYAMYLCCVLFVSLGQRYLCFIICWARPYVVSVLI